ncbi:hypothetical protein [Terrisporobacter mayombei]|uniref:Uncharacterized protein n=2 Tax=Terrisporobacter mayombei TaxID=1541 RepID=A0ABY9PY62_9FIRM|nr:hypothetical protein [Terrisporobacter mayombei]WMT80648.1 hypothetical protein TEMA_09690 [Terrisporobacter mayombei]
MAKKWIDGNKIAEVTEMPEDLYRYDDLMKSVPNFDKTDGAKKVYSRKEYIILQVKKGYVVYNTTRPFEKSHTHLRSFSMAKTIIDNCIIKKAPKTNNLYLLESHVRVSDDTKYIKLVEELIEAKRDKDKLKYRNKNINSKKK